MNCKKVCTIETIVYICRITNKQTYNMKYMTYPQAQRFVPSPRDIIDHLCDQGMDAFCTAEELTSAADEIRHIAVMQVCTGISHSELACILDIATDYYFHAQAKTRWAAALDKLTAKFNALISAANYAA